MLNDWESMIPDLVAEEFDAIIAGMSITGKRDQTIDFTEPYYLPLRPSIWPVRARATMPSRVGSEPTPTPFTRPTSPSRASRTPMFRSEDERIEALLNGDIDASLVDHAYAVEKLREYDGQLAIVGPSMLLDRGIGIGVREDDGLKAALTRQLHP